MVFKYVLGAVLVVVPALCVLLLVCLGQPDQIPSMLWEFYSGIPESILRISFFVMGYFLPAKSLYDYSFRCEAASAGEKVSRLLSYMWFGTILLYRATESVAWRWKGVELNTVILISLAAAELVVYASMYMLARGFGWPEYHYLTVTLWEDIRQGKVFPRPEPAPQVQDIEKDNTQDKAKAHE